MNTGRITDIIYNTLSMYNIHITALSKIHLLGKLGKFTLFPVIRRTIIYVANIWFIIRYKLLDPSHLFQKPSRITLWHSSLNFPIVILLFLWAVMSQHNILSKPKIELSMIGINVSFQIFTIFAKFSSWVIWMLFCMRSLCVNWCDWSSWFWFRE